MTKIEDYIKRQLLQLSYVTPGLEDLFGKKLYVIREKGELWTYGETPEECKVKAVELIYHRAIYRSSIGE